MNSHKITDGKQSKEVIVGKLRSKDKKSFDFVYKEYFHIMLSYAGRFLDRYEEAEEVTQEVFVRFWEKCETLAIDSSVKSYLYRSIHNICLNHLKHEKVKDIYRSYVIDYLERTSETDDFETKITDIQQKIFNEVNNLPPRCSEIFKLSKYEGLKYQEIAKFLGISVKTVEVQMGKALRVLREKFKGINPT